jgi:hypothetical protein
MPAVTVLAKPSVVEHQQRRRRQRAEHQPAGREVLRGDGGLAVMQGGQYLSSRSSRPWAASAQITKTSTAMTSIDQNG